MKPLPTLAAFCLIALALAPPATAQGLPDGPLAEARILPGWRMSDGSHMAGLEITMPQGWHTYWRSPGDAGIPPLFDWSGSDGVAAVSVAWPVPQVFVDGGTRSLGYEDRVVLPLRIRPSGSGPVTLSAAVDLGVCKNICVPASVSASAALPAPGARDGRIAAALADGPLSAKEARATATCRITPTSDGVQVEARIALAPTGGREHGVIESANPLHWVSQPTLTRQGQRITLTAEINHVEGRAVALDRDGLRLTVLGKTRAVDIRGCPAG